MSRSPITFALALFAVALVAVPTAFAKQRDHRVVRIQGTCTQHSTSKLKLSREDRGIEVEFEVDQNRNGVPWRVMLSRNGKVVASFEIRRVLAGRLGIDRITASATRASGETCTARSSSPRANGTPAAPADDTADDHGRHTGGHA